MVDLIHLERKAILYIRQSTMRQVHVNTESTIRQYALKERLMELGWCEEMIEIIDCDLGQSGTEISRRSGFRQMLADVGEGEVGAIASLECSRLSRSFGDWGRLTEICALGNTLLIDDDGIYDPNDFNDRLLLGLKGTMSEAELHFLQERMRGGALNKAHRGELKNSLPAGYVFDGAGNITKDPDIQIQEAIALFFESFRICGSAHRVCTYYGEKGYLFPADRNRGFGMASDICWDSLTPSRAQKILRSPMYAGIYTYGRIQSQKTAKGKRRRAVPEEQWISCITDHHESYISEDEYRANCETLESNATRNGASPPREGNALLQGIAICAKCGSRLSLSYKSYHGTQHGQYVCGHIQKGMPYSHKQCLCINGRVVDEAVSDIVLQKLTPEAVKAASEIQKELETRAKSEKNYFVLQVEKSQYEVELARKRYMNADPENRLVCSELEKLWNERMNQLTRAESELKRHEKESLSRQPIPEIERLMKFPEELRKAWHSNKINMVDKKRILRCLVEDVTLDASNSEIFIGIRFKGGMLESMAVKRPPKKYETWTTKPEIVKYIREASKKNTVEEMVAYLNSHHETSGKGLAFTMSSIRGIQYSYGIPSLKKHLISCGYLSTEEKAKQMGISSNALNKRRISGLYKGSCIKTTSSGDYMYEP